MVSKTRMIELVRGHQAQAVERAMDFYALHGKKPIRLHKEVPGHLANRLQAALWREAVDAVASGLASVEQVTEEARRAMQRSEEALSHTQRVIHGVGNTVC